jgi:hypothetical protein
MGARARQAPTVKSFLTATDESSRPSVVSPKWPGDPAEAPAWRRGAMLSSFTVTFGDKTWTKGEVWKFFTQLQ